MPTRPETRPPVLPPQVSPPAFALSALLPHQLEGVEVLALPFTVDHDTPVLGAGAAEAGSALGLDLAGLLTSRRAKGTVACAAQTQRLLLRDGPRFYKCPNSRRAGAGCICKCRRPSAIGRADVFADGVDRLAARCAGGSSEVRMGRCVFAANLTQ